MVKLNYFRILEELSQLLLKGVQAACAESRGARDVELSKLRLDMDKKICMLEDSLFVDFIPPLERDNIAAYAHCLSRVLDRAIDYYYETVSLLRVSSVNARNEESSVCIELAEKLVRSTELLRKLRHNESTPDIADFREALQRGREAHCMSLSKLNSGTVPRSYGQLIITVGRLRFELSRCFDELIEIMLNNI